MERKHCVEFYWVHISGNKVLIGEGWLCFTFRVVVFVCQCVFTFTHICEHFLCLFEMYIFCIRLTYCGKTEFRGCGIKHSANNTSVDNLSHSATARNP